jgi:HAD superfamily hydrolase (TIGR01509 family)
MTSAWVIHRVDKMTHRRHGRLRRLLAMKHSIDWLVFDLGGVVVDVQAAEVTIGELSRRSRTAAERLGDVLRERFTMQPFSIAERFQIGELSEAGFHAALNEALVEPLEPDIVTAELEAMLLGERTQMIALMKNLSRSHHIACYSNTNAVHWRYMKQHFRFFDCVERAFASQEIGFAKPDRRGFDYVANALDARPSACLLIDDRQINVDGAQAAGWQALHFQSIDRLRDDLAAYGVESAT